MQIKIKDKIHVLNQVMLSNNYIYIKTNTMTIVREYDKTLYAEYAYKSLLYYMKQKNRNELLENQKVKYILKNSSTVYSVTNEKDTKTFCKKCHILLKGSYTNYCYNCGIPLKETT